MICSRERQKQRPWVSFPTQSVAGMPKVAVYSMNPGIIFHQLVYIKLLPSPFWIMPDIMEWVILDMNLQSHRFLYCSSHLGYYAPFHQRI